MNCYIVVQRFGVVEVMSRKIKLCYFCFRIEDGIQPQIHKLLFFNATDCPLSNVDLHRNMCRGDCLGGILLTIVRESAKLLLATV